MPAVRGREQDRSSRADPPPQPAVPPKTPAWRVRLLGTLEVEHEGRRIARFRAQRYGILLAYLALRPGQTHGRDELIELLWPDADGDTGRTRLRQALASLRRQLEPPGTPPGSVLVTRGHVGVGLDPANVGTDVADFEAHLRRAADAAAALPPDEQEQARRLQAALDVYAGPLLPGFWPEWAVRERERLGAAHVDALRRLAALREASGDPVAALDLARRAGLADPDHLPALVDVMRLLAATGRGDDALRQFDTITHVAGREGEAIPAEARALAGELRRRRRSGPPARRGTPPPPPEASIPGLPPNASAARGGERALTPRLPPVPLAPFFGRETETAQVLDLLRDRRRGARLVTLTGMGGSGKTRLALHVARQWDEAHGGGKKDASSSPVCVFVPLVDVSGPGALPAAVAGALRLDRGPGRAPTEQIVEALSRRPPSLLVLDNFETLLGDRMDEPAGAALWVVTLLQSLPSLACLVTSRQRLLVDGEQELPVPPLPVPPSPPDPLPGLGAGGPQEEGVDLAGLLAVPSVALFVDRAQRARPDFQITAGNAGAVARLCARLEGIPLAIEIAAARSNSLSASALLARLDEAGRFPLLTCRRRDLPPRHRTLRAAIEASVRALPPDLQTFFARLSVFRGGWTAEAAAAVCDLPLDRAEDALAQLREHSLIEATAASPTLHPDGDDAPLRFALLETLREFGAELLEETLGEDEAAVLRERHARHFLALAEEAEPHLFGPDPVPWLDRLEAERANLHAALERSLAAGRHERSLEAALRLLRPLARFWRMRGHVGEGRRVYASLLARVRQSASAATTPALAQLEQKALHFAGHLANRQGDYGSARSLFEQGLRLSREREDPKAAADFLSGLGYVAMYQSDFAAARAHHEEALRLCEANRDVISVGSVLYALGHLADFEKKHDRARTYFERALAVWGNHPEGQSGARYALLNLGHGARCTGDFGRARSHYAESLRRFVQAGDRLGVAQALEGFASLIVTDQRTESAPEGAARDAALWYGAAERLREAVGTPLPAFARAALHEAPMNAARAILGEAAFTGAWAEGRALPMEQAVGSALAESASCTASDAGTNLTSEEAAAAPTQAA